MLKGRQTVAEKSNEYQEGQHQLETIKAELVKQEFQDNLEENIKQRLDELTQKLNQTKSGRNFSIIELKSLISMKNYAGVSVKYNNSELLILFDYYKKFIEKINETQQYLPTKKNFCSFIGVSSVSYDNWRQSEDSERREIMQMIDDYITDIMLTSAQNGDIKEITTMFKAKTEHGYVEATAPIVIEHKTETNLDAIRKQIEALNKGKSLKGIELKKNDDGTYSPEE